MQYRNNVQTIKKVNFDYILTEMLLIKICK